MYARYQTAAKGAPGALLPGFDGHEVLEHRGLFL